MAPVHLFRVIVSVTDIDEAAGFYSALFETPGRRVSPGRHYFDAGAVIFACLDAESDGDDTPHCPNPEPVYFAVHDLQSFFERAKRRELIGSHVQIKTQPWGERSFYMQDPFGNPLCFVEESTRFTGESEVVEQIQEVSVS